MWPGAGAEAAAPLAKMAGMAGKARGTETTGDMVRTVFILIGALAVVAGIFAFNRPDARLPDPVDYESVLEIVQDEYPYDVLAPSSLPDNWRATSVYHQQDGAGHRWRVGFLIDDDHFVGLEQSDGEIVSYQTDRLGGFTEDGARTIDGVAWQRWVEQDERPDRALLRVDDGVLTIVRGTQSYDALAEFISWLE